MRQLSWKIFAFRQAIALSNCQATAKVNIRFGSTGNGGSALFGPIVDRMKSRLWTTTEDRWKMADILAPMHPGEVLDELYLRPLGDERRGLGKEIGRAPHAYRAHRKGPDVDNTGYCISTGESIQDNAALLDEYADELRSCPGRCDSRCIGYSIS